MEINVSKVRNAFNFENGIIVLTKIGSGIAFENDKGVILAIREKNGDFEILCKGKEYLFIDGVLTTKDIDTTEPLDPPTSPEQGMLKEPSIEDEKQAVIKMYVKDGKKISPLKEDCQHELSYYQEAEPSTNTPESCICDNPNCLMDLPIPVNPLNSEGRL